MAQKQDGSGRSGGKPTYGKYDKPDPRPDGKAGADGVKGT